MLFFDVFAFFSCSAGTESRNSAASGKIEAAITNSGHLWTSATLEAGDSLEENGEQYDIFKHFYRIYLERNRYATH